MDQMLSLPLQQGQELWLLMSNNRVAGDDPSSYVIEELRAFRDTRMSQESKEPRTSTNAHQ
jgi:hypothetical protein